MTLNKSLERDVLKGTRAQFRRYTSSNFMCGYSFKQGEEKVFFIHEGRVNIASVEPASPWLIAALESKLKGDNAPNKVLRGAFRATRL